MECSTGSFKMLVSPNKKDKKYENDAGAAGNESDDDDDDVDDITTQNIFEYVDEDTLAEYQTIFDLLDDDVSESIALFRFVPPVRSVHPSFSSSAHAAALRVY